jgi:soluble lytic murein transglycosylase-like protein
MKMNRLTENQVYSYAMDWANAYASKVGADPQRLARTLMAIAKVESNYDASAKNKKSSARGLMQMLINTQREVELKHAKVPFAVAGMRASSFPKAPFVTGGPDAMYDPNYSMQLAAAYLAYQYKRYKGDWTKAIHAYNQGSYPGTRKNDGIAYVKKVNNNLSAQNKEYTYTPQSNVIATANGNKYIYSVFI